MEKFMEKLSSYNILNNLLPGTIFCYFMDMLFNINLLKNSIIVDLFLFYFMGMIVSRIGSVMIEPALKKVKFVEFVEYDEYLTASKKDPKIDVLSETNNTYCTILGLCATLLICRIYISLCDIIPGLNNCSLVIIIISISILFAFAYKKQTSYITKRVKKANENNMEGAV